ncbi:MAG: hypothetical protein IH944_01865 [Armatimonadetes bacterium]|nr:hypothetical protein [Armatimonadota bacterium]
MRLLFYAVFAVSVLAVACDKDSEQVAAQPDFTGKWVGHTKISEEYIDVLHESYPDGDREVLARTTRRDYARIVQFLELNDDGTALIGIDGAPVETMSEGTWELSPDGESITISMLSGEISEGSSTYDPVTGETIVTEEKITPGTLQPRMSLEISVNRQSMTDSAMSVGSVIYSRPGSAVVEMPVPDAPYTYAESGEVADFVGDWTFRFDMDAYWADMRGMWSEAEVQRMKEEDDSETDSLQLSDDMTYRWFGDGMPFGTWELSDDGATLLLLPPLFAVEAIQMEATELDAMTAKLRLTEDGTTLVAHDPARGGFPFMILKRK